jgi:hypothetical protein
MALTAKDLVGTWTFQSFSLVGRDGAVTKPWGDDHDGQIVYSPDGFMSVLIRRPGGVLAYCGPYAIEGDAVVHRIEIATDPKLVGTAQRRFVKLDGRRVTLTSEESLVGGPGTQANLVWERAT